MSEPRQGPDQTGASGYPANTDPAYSGQYWTPGYPDQTYGGHTYGGQSYGQGYGAPMAAPTEQLPAYWQPGVGYQPALRHRRRSRRSHRAGSGSWPPSRCSWSPGWYSPW